VPGNLLLLGEYAVLEPGGLGLALAVERRIKIKVYGSSQLRIKGKMGNESIVWNPGRSQNLLFDCIWMVCEKYCSLKKSRFRPTGHILIDSSDFFNKGGRKLGLGSSAAVTVGLVFYFLWPFLRRIKNSLPIIQNIALQAHRIFQGGVGSGYDICASLYGRMGIFRGGVNPDWNFITERLFFNYYILTGKRSVKTPDAITRYLYWKSKNRRLAKKFLTCSNKLVKFFISSTDFLKQTAYFHEYRKLGLWLGKKIGVETSSVFFKRKIADLQKKQFLMKPIGAGGEIAIVMKKKSKDEIKDQDLIPFTIARKGLLWKY